MNKNFGSKVKRLREELGLSREEFCEAESNLTTRQLQRIESGDSKPTLTTMHYIADRLGKPLYELMPDYIALPQEYTKLKYRILREPTYAIEPYTNEKLELIQTVYQEFYRDLPEEEKFAVDVIRTLYDNTGKELGFTGERLLVDHLEPLAEKTAYTVNDLLLCRLLSDAIYMSEEPSVDRKLLLVEVMRQLPDQVDLLDPNDLFILRDTIFNMIPTAGKCGLPYDFNTLVDTLEEIAERTQDIQKMPLVKLLRAKYHLLELGDKEKGSAYYEEALTYAQMINDPRMIERIHRERESDQIHLL